jgi:hypothetical protein
LEYRVVVLLIERQPFLRPARHELVVILDGHGRAGLLGTDE